MQMPLLQFKSLIIENQLTSQSQTYNISIYSLATQITISGYIHSFKQKNNIILPLQWKIYDPELLDYRLFSVQQPLSEIYFLSPVIMLKYQELSIPDFDMGVLNLLKKQQEQIRGKKGQRTIKKVIQYVKQWRSLSNSLDKYKNKISLIDAAQIVGISKKSLDDYFCQLRLAQQYGFDFQSNINQKIGVLRTFVRKYRAKARSSKKREKIPTKLRLIQQYQYQNPNLPQIIPSTKVQIIKQQQQFIETVISYPHQLQPSLKIQNQVEPLCLNWFNEMIDDIMDPVVDNHSIQRNYQSMNQQQSSEFLLF